MILKYKPSIGVLQETKCDKYITEEVVDRCWRGCESMEIDAICFSEGLMILCNRFLVNMNNLIEMENAIAA
jgi:hypothetical protein